MSVNCIVNGSSNSMWLVRCRAITAKFCLIFNWILRKRFVGNLWENFNQNPEVLFRWYPLQYVFKMLVALRDLFLSMCYCNVIHSLASKWRPLDSKAINNHVVNASAGKKHLENGLELNCFSCMPIHILWAIWAVIFSSTFHVSMKYCRVNHEEE